MWDLTIVQCSRCGKDVPVSACYQQGSPMKLTCAECMGIFSESRDPDDAMAEAAECVREWREQNDPDYFDTP